MVERGIWALRDDGLYHNPDGVELKLTIHPDDVEALLSIRDYWKGQTLSTTADAWQPEEYDELWDCALETTKRVGGLPLFQNDDVVSSATMRAAQKDSEAYRNLVVRIAGYSAYFVELNRDCQEDIIRRTENYSIQ